VSLCYLYGLAFTPTPGPEGRLSAVPTISRACSLPSTLSLYIFKVRPLIPDRTASKSRITSGVERPPLSAPLLDALRYPLSLRALVWSILVFLFLVSSGVFRRSFLFSYFSHVPRSMDQGSSGSSHESFFAPLALFSLSPHPSFPRKPFSPLQRSFSLTL